jgi:hypothetical protein
VDKDFYSINAKIKKFSEKSDWYSILKLGKEIKECGLDPMEFPLYNYAYAELINEREWIEENVPKDYIERMKELENKKMEFDNKR